MSQLFALFTFLHLEANMNIRSETRKIRLQEWRRIIEDKISSGLTIEEYCRTNNLNVHTYKYWLHILREEELNQQYTPFTELVVADKTAVAPITEIASSITINIGKGSITVQNKEALKTVVEVLLNAQ